MSHQLCLKFVFAVHRCSVKHTGTSGFLSTIALSAKCHCLIGKLMSNLSRHTPDLDTTCASPPKITESHFKIRILLRLWLFYLLHRVFKKKQPFYWLDKKQNVQCWLTIGAISWMWQLLCLGVSKSVKMQASDRVSEHVFMFVPVTFLFLMY